MAATPVQTQTLGSHALSSTATWTLQPEPGAQSAAPTEPCEQLNENIHSNSLDQRTLLKVASASFSFFCAGVNDGSTGAIIPHVIRDYNVNTAIVSSIYGATFAGWVVAALTNTHLGQYLDLGAMLALGAVLQILAQALRAWMPPFGLYVTTFFLVAVGAAYNDTHANTFVATVRGAHRWLAVIHASFMGGCLVGPFVATAVASAGEQRTWNLFYVFPVGICLANLGFIAWAFRDSLTLKHRKPLPVSADNEGEESQTTRGKGATALIRAALGRPAVWPLSLFFFFYIGSQITSNGWVVEYLVEVRGGDLSRMGYVPAGFNGGCLLGRLLLAEPTHRLGERRMVFIYCVLAVGLQILFWMVPNIIAASVAISFVGFFTGPLFATGINVGTKLFPPGLHATALAFVFVFAQMGGSFFPVIAGVIASSEGVGTLQPILVAILACTGISWVLVPSAKRQGNVAALHEE
ncbi:Bypass of stop codon protein-like protein [Emericellopsis cladophorae]|uniref:Bypass of stop codon protein-like protein n=1 Tax=Emericellopsis cladophorae TaxID=2686198 RepID=A0A9P9XWL2_9HYPO|nr:Bypass of stop codon protein-like protein [Emericellopsis cladophorae]KAI6778679.1 Bypass of stop codon protein-like protein [Emericellopsis cladophorae]